MAEKEKMSIDYESPNSDQQSEYLAPSEGVWPPPPVFEPEVTTFFPFSAEMRVAEGSASDFREGILIFSDHGLRFHGKAVVRSEIQVFVMLASVLILTPFELRPVCMFVYLILALAFRRDTEIGIAYHDVQRMILNAAKRRVCLVYDAPNYKGILKRHSLTTEMEPDAYEAFVTAAQPYLAGKLAEGKTRLWLSPVAWLTLIYWVLWIGSLILSSNFGLMDLKFHWKI